MVNNFLSSSPLWKNQTFSSYYPSLNSDLATDVCIIGAGITGLTTAYHLAMLGKNVIVLDSGQPGAGETGNTTAHLSNALDDYYFQIEKLHGLKYAALAAESHSTAINYIEKIVKDHAIQCDFTRLPGYLFSSDTSLLHQEMKAAQRAGLVATTLVDGDNENVFFKNQALLFPDQGQLHPLKYLAALAEIIVAKGVKLFSSTHATKLVPQADKTKVITQHNLIITASQVVTATNAPFAGNLKLHAKLIPHRTYAIGCLVEKDSIKTALYWDTAEPYHYVRLQPYDSQWDVLIIGGEDHRVGDIPKNNPYLQLENWAKNYFPALPPIQYRWSGQILEPVDSLAYIGPHPKFKNVYVATGDSGHGMTHGTLAALLISDLIEGCTNPWSKLYHPARFSIKAWKEMLKHNLAACYSYLRYLFPKCRKRLATLQNGEGAIVQYGLKKRAIYKDELGKIHECAAVCPHLKSLLQWNPLEKTWDCPAHGSRFDTQGNILNGPANKKLKCFSILPKTSK